MIGRNGETISTPPAATAGSSKLHLHRLWSHLPRDLLWQILKLLQIEDYIQFRAVCNFWHSTAAERRHPPAEIQRPQLILSINNVYWFLQRPDRLKGRTSSLHPLPEELRGGHPLSCSRGWVAIQNQQKSNLFLFNPITGTVIMLPKLYLRDITFIRKLTLSASATSKDCMVAVKRQSGRFNEVIVCRPSDCRWTPLLVTNNNCPEEQVRDMTFCGGVLYIIHGNLGGLLAATFGRNETLSFSMVELGTYSFLSLWRLADLQGRRLVALPYHEGNLWFFDNGQKKWVSLKGQEDVCISVANFKHDCICVPAAALADYGNCQGHEHFNWIFPVSDCYYQISEGHSFCIKYESLINTDTGFVTWISPSLDTY